jgi:hypothetical protein
MYLHRIALSVVLPARSPQDHDIPAVSPLQVIIKKGAEQLPAGVHRGRRMGVCTTDSPDSSPMPPAKSATTPRGGLVKQKSLGSTGSASPMAVRIRSSSFHSVPETTPLAKPGKVKGKSPLLKRETVTEFGNHNRKNPFTKADSVLSSLGSEAKPEEEGGVSELDEWRGLSLDTMRRRIQRLVVLMNLSEPGTIPNANILASLVDLVSEVRSIQRFASWF